MAENGSSKTPTKKANLMDPNSIKHFLDESVSEIVKSRGYTENVTISNVKLLMGTIIIIVALAAQFYPTKFPANRHFLLGCIVLYISLNGLLQFIIYTKEKDAIMFTYPLSGSFNSTGLVLSSKMRRFSDVYTLSIASADPKSVSAKESVELSKSVSQWFANDGCLVEGLFWKDVEGLINKYSGESRKIK